MKLQAPNLWYNSCSSKLSEKRRQDFKKWGFLLAIFMQLIPLFYLTMKFFYWCFFYFNIMKSIVFTVNWIFFLIFYWLLLLKKHKSFLFVLTENNTKFLCKLCIWCCVGLRFSLEYPVGVRPHCCQTLAFRWKHKVGIMVEGENTRRVSTVLGACQWQQFSSHQWGNTSVCVLMCWIRYKKSLSLV